MTESTHMGRILSGFTLCPTCLITNRRQEERMAQSAEYDRVFCFSCLRSSNQIKPAHADTIKALPAAFANLVAGLISYQHTQRNSQVVIPYRLMQIWGINSSNGRAETLTSEHQRMKLEFQLDRNKGDDLIELYLTKQPREDSPFFALSRPAVNYEIKKHLSDVEIPPSRLKALKELISRGFTFESVDIATCICSVKLICDGKNKATSDAPEVHFKWHYC